MSGDGRTETVLLPKYFNTTRIGTSTGSRAISKSCGSRSANKQETHELCTVPFSELIGEVARQVPRHPCRALPVSKWACGRVIIVFYQKLATTNIILRNMNKQRCTVLSLQRSGMLKICSRTDLPEIGEAWLRHVQRERALIYALAVLRRPSTASSSSSRSVSRMLFLLSFVRVFGLTHKLKQKCISLQ